MVLAFQKKGGGAETNKQKKPTESLLPHSTPVNQPLTKKEDPRGKWRKFESKHLAGASQKLALKTKMISLMKRRRNVLSNHLVFPQILLLFRIFILKPDNISSTASPVHLSKLLFVKEENLEYLTLFGNLIPQAFYCSNLTMDALLSRA